MDALGNTYLYVRADDAVVQYDSVTFDFATAGSAVAGDVPHAVTPTAAVAEWIVGIAQVAIAAGDYGWVLIKGTGSADVLGTVVQGDTLVSTAVSGQLDVQPSTAVNPVTTDFDALVARGLTVVATADDTANVAPVYVF
jgi:hypothetical protein